MWRWNSAKGHPETSMKKVKLKDLKKHLPKDTLYLTPDERRAVLGARKVFYQARAH